MAHLSLQIGAAIPVPIVAPESRSGRPRSWRHRALHEVAVQASQEERWPIDQLLARASHLARRFGCAHPLTALEGE